MRRFYQKMEKDVIISIRGMQDFEGVGNDAIELVTEGRLRHNELLEQCSVLRLQSQNT